MSGTLPVARIDAERSPLGFGPPRQSSANRPGARHVLQAVEEALEACPAERAVEKEDRSRGDEADQFRRIALKEAHPCQPQPVCTRLRGAREHGLDLQADATRTGLEMCQ